MIEKQKKISVLPAVLLSYFLISGVWAAYRLFLDKPMTALFLPVVAALLEGVIKSLVLIVPSLLMMRALKPEMEIPGKKVFSLTVRSLLSGLILGLIFFAFYTLRHVLAGGVRFSFAISADELISTVFFAAVTEEIMYRGFILNTLVKKFGKEWAIVATSVLFALMHLPLWLATGGVDLMTILSRLLSTACIGYLLGWLFLRDKVIWGAVLAHALHNLIVNVVVGK